MKYLVLLACFLSFTVGCNSKPETPFTCIHPAIMGGMPFQLPPKTAHFNNGIVRFKAPTGNTVSVIGLICIKVEE